MKGIPMSISDSFRDPSHGSEPDDTRPDAPEISEALDRVQFRVQHIDPIVRDCNRNMTDLLGPCPNTASGNWITVDDDLNVTVGVSDVVDVARLGAALEDISRRIDLAETGTRVQSNGSLRQYLEMLARDHTVPVQGGSIHLGARRNNRNLKKGL